MKVLIYKSTGSWYVVKDDEHNIYNARIKGVMKIEGITSTNPIAVGDHVEAEMENEGEHTLTISSIGQRKNYIARVSPHNKNQHHIIASNLDQCMLFATLKDPKTSQGFIDRFLLQRKLIIYPQSLFLTKKIFIKRRSWKNLRS